MSDEPAPAAYEDSSVFDSVCERGRRALVSVLIEENPGEIYLGSGCLVRIGGVEFVLTAAHNVWHPTEARLMSIAAGQLPEQIFALVRPGDGSVRKVHVRPTTSAGCPDPDVAVLELSEKALRHLNRQPFSESEIGFLESDAVARRVVVCGFPAQLVIQQPGLEIAGVKRKPQLNLGGVSMIVHSMARRRFEQEPELGRGIHVFFSKTSTERDGSRLDTHASHGMSGGPLISPQGDGILVGLVRSREEFEDGYDQWCEPAIEAIRLLVDHENANVAAAAAKIISDHSIVNAPTQSRMPY